VSALPERSWAEIDSAAIRHNVRALKAWAGSSEIMPLVKADAYGHGMLPLAHWFEDSGCHWIGCASVHEGRALRDAGIRTPILLLSGFLPQELDEIHRLGLTLTLSSPEEARQAAATAKRRRRPLDVQVKIDTGMGRLGVAVPDAPALIRASWNSPHLTLTGVYSHYACADSDRAFTRRQWKAFQSVVSPAGIPRHICNSAGMFTLPESSGDIVRPGLAIYGICPQPRHQPLLRPALTWKSRVVAVKTVPKGTTLSYGATFTTPRPMRIAVVAVGYGDGLFRSLSNQGEVLCRGRRCRILGRVTMDQILIDLTRVPSTRKGDEVVLLGKQGREEILASAMAAKAGTVAYEIWCHITDRVKKIYI
jgi:alanine racemase